MVYGAGKPLTTKIEKVGDLEKKERVNGNRERKSGKLKKEGY